MDNWGALEADFQEVYGIDALSVSWRKFMVLLRGLPPTSRLHQAVFMANPKNLLDIAMGRKPTVKRRVSLEEFKGSI